jgi:hypothetical protein
VKISVLFDTNYTFNDGVFTFFQIFRESGHLWGVFFEGLFLIIGVDGIVLGYLFQVIWASSEHIYPRLSFSLSMTRGDDCPIKAALVCSLTFDCLTGLVTSDIFIFMYSYPIKA